MSFDAKGRMWVVEMIGYMPDSLGRGEDQPSGNIVILDDKNKDGIADERTVFLDSLVLPRAICLIDGGILVAEPPRLWHYDIQDGKPANKVLVDARYAVDGNVEHQPNGLIRALDNWIYNAKSSKRYRKIKGEWIIQDTHFRGQWGITQDNYGRLYYNDNSTNLVGDYFSPGFGSTNKNQRDLAGYTERTVNDNRVYPIRPTPGVNRGYNKGILDDSLKLTNFTAACGPVIYRGDLFGDTYQFNAFVAEPSANLIKRNVLSESGFVVKGTQAYKEKEFLASLDERFRPVNLLNGPDGALYVLDMYRGIIQHKTYVTPYLSEQFKRRDLSAPLNCGRIYRIVPKNKKVEAVILPEGTAQLVGMLGHASGYVRDMAQQVLVDRQDKAAIPYLEQALKNTDNPLQVIHSMWVLEGLSALKTNDVLTLLNAKDWPVRMQALTVLPSVINSTSYKYYIMALQQLLSANDELAAPYLGFLAHYLKPFDEAAANDLLVSLVKKYPDNRFVADAVISNQGYKEEAFEKAIAQVVPDTNMRIRKQLSSVIARFKSAQKNRDPELLAKRYPKGALLYQSSCQTCHAPDGNGIQSLAPPLNKSQWVTGDKNKLIPIVLYGLTGPINVNGHVYQAPEISGDMPGVGNSEEISDEEIAQVLSFIRSSWQNDAGKIEVKDVVSVRSKYKGRTSAFTEEELIGKK
ncbi:MAG: dehydrogenase [Sphingobacteriales bacterium]|nr:MAG: dehydrogenase [Sphingobacteriales bacterium]